MRLKVWSGMKIIPPPALREIALMGGVLTSLALDTLVDWHDPEVLPIARKLVARKEPGDQLLA